LAGTCRVSVSRAITVLLALAALLAVSPSSAADAESPVALLTVDGAISPATADYAVRGLHKAADRGATLVVIQLDTPGGLDTSMRRLLKEILVSPVPVATFVGPRGARAASAGTFIIYASHIAAMAPATNLGAASPVRIGGAAGEPARTQEKKRGGKSAAKDGKSQDKESEEASPSCGAATPNGRSGRCGRPSAFPPRTHSS
jgi:membrane-bound serine protease (ClpP class)